MDGRVAGKVALITGGARGQGRSHAIALAREGADVILFDICAQIESVTAYPMSTPEDLAETARLVEKEGRRAAVRQVDVRDRGALIEATRTAVAEMGRRLDIVVANAGIVEAGPDAPAVSFLDTVSVILGGTINTVEAAFPHLGPGASIIAIGSFAALVHQGRDTQGAGPGLVGYAHAKRAVSRLVHDLAAQLGPLDIRVNAIHPGNVETRMLLNETLYKVFRPDLESPTRADAEPVIDGMHRLPVTYISPTDISNAVLFLASEESRCVTGLQLKVEAGGLLASTTSGAPG